MLKMILNILMGNNEDELLKIKIIKNKKEIKSLKSTPKGVLL